jgi:hypothetical protein
LTPTAITGNAGRPGYLPATNDIARGYGRCFLVDALVHGPISGDNNLPATDVPVGIYAFLHNPAGTSGGTIYEFGVSLTYTFAGVGSAYTQVEYLWDLDSARNLIVGAGNLGISTAANSHGHRPTVLAIASTPTGVGGHIQGCQFFALPNPGSPSVGHLPYVNNLFTDTSNFVAGVFIILHQGRVIVVSSDGAPSDNQFTSAGIYYHPEQLWLAAYGKFDLTQPDFFGPQIIVEEDPSGIGTWCSVSANQLIIIKNAGGAVEISGALDNPTVLRLPGIRSTGGLPNIAVSVPGHNFRYPGVAYGTAAGAFLWAGLDNSESISENLDPLFWLYDRNWPGAVFGIECYTANGSTGTGSFYGIYGPVGRFAYTHPWLFTPNGWVCDFRSDAWWQIEDPNGEQVHITHWYSSSRPSKVWGFRAYIDDTNTSAGLAFDLEQGQHSYYYESQPLAKSRNRYIECREILATIVGLEGDTVAFTLKGYGGEGVTQTVTLAASGMQVVRLNAGLFASWVQVQITSTSTNSDDAPRVLAVSVGYVPQGIL